MTASLDRAAFYGPAHDDAIEKLVAVVRTHDDQQVSELLRLLAAEGAYQALAAVAKVADAEAEPHGEKCQRYAAQALLDLVDFFTDKLAVDGSLAGTLSGRAL